MGLIIVLLQTKWLFNHRVFKIKKKHKHFKVLKMVVFLEKGGLEDSQLLVRQGPGSVAESECVACRISEMWRWPRGKARVWHRLMLFRHLVLCCVTSNLTLPVIFKSYSIPLGADEFHMQESPPFPLQGNTK